MVGRGKPVQAPVAGLRLLKLPPPARYNRVPSVVIVLVPAPRLLGIEVQSLRIRSYTPIFELFSGYTAYIFDFKMTAPPLVELLDRLVPGSSDQPCVMGL